MQPINKKRELRSCTSCFDILIEDYQNLWNKFETTDYYTEKFRLGSLVKLISYYESKLWKQLSY